MKKRKAAPRKAAKTVRPVRPAAKKKSTASKSAARSAVASQSAVGTAAPVALRRELYPAIEPFRTGYLRVSEIHEIYYEESGNPAGKPAIFLHGGPGAGSDKACSPILRSSSLPYRRIRSARLRPEPAERELD